MNLRTIITALYDLLNKTASPPYFLGMIILILGIMVVSPFLALAGLAVAVATFAAAAYEVIARNVTRTN